MSEVLVLPAMVVGLSLWPAIFFWSIAFAIFIELCFDQGIVALATLICAVLASFWLGFISLDFVYQHQAAFLWLLAFYIPAGIVWATIRWYPLYVFGVRNKVRKFLATEQARLRQSYSNDVDAIARGMMSVRDSLTYKFEELPPRVLNHKSDLVRWMAWWPFSIVTYLLGEFLRELFTAIYDGFADMWQRLSNHAFRNVDYQNPPALEPDPNKRIIG